MKSPLPGARAAHLLLLATMLLLPCGDRRSFTAPTDRANTSLVKLPPEVRLRKLHLVRPDLIQYPIDFEYYC